MVERESDVRGERGTPEEVKELRLSGKGEGQKA